MKKELFPLLLGLTLMTSSTMAQNPAKPYVIQNLLNCPVSIEKHNGQRLPDLKQNQSTPSLGAEDFPVHVFSGCGVDFLSPPLDNSWSKQCYHVVKNELNQLHLIPAIPCPSPSPS